jgi:hypothetical protein
MLIERVSGIHSAIDGFARTAVLSANRFRATIIYLSALGVFLCMSLFFQWGGWIRLAAFLIGPVPFLLSEKMSRLSSDHTFLISSCGVLGLLFVISYKGVRSYMRRADEERQRRAADENFRALVLRTVQPKEAVEEEEVETPKEPRKSRRSTAPAKKS